MRAAAATVTAAEAVARGLQGEQIRLHLNEARCNAVANLLRDSSPLPQAGEGGRRPGEGKLRVVGNLPYNISTPLLFHLAGHAPAIRDIHVMLQKEVVARMVAPPGDSEYGRLSVMLQYRFGMECVLEVPGAAFRPAPKVESALVRMIPHRPLLQPARDESLFASIVAAAFAQRRKTLRNTLKGHFGTADFARLGMDPAQRAQELRVEDFVRLANDRLRQENSQ